MKTTISLCAAVQGIGGGLGWSLVPALMPQIARDLHLTHAMGGVVWGAAPLGIALAAPLGGALVDRHGPRRVAGLALLVGAAACAARVLAWDAWSLAAAMFVFGLHIGVTAPAIPKAIAGNVPADRLARANGIALLAYTLGTAATILCARWFGGWRTAMLQAAGAMTVVAALWLLLLRDGAGRARHARMGDVVRLARDPALVRLAAMQFLLFGGYLALLGLLPRALSEAGMPPARVALAVAGWLTVAGVANFVGPWISDRIGARRPVLLGGAAVAGFGLLAFALSPGAIGFLLLAAAGGGAVAPLLLALPLELPSVGPARAGAALGLLMLVGQVGGFLLPILVGAVAQNAGFAAALAVLALAHTLLVLPARAVV